MTSHRTLGRSEPKIHELRTAQNIQDHSKTCPDSDVRSAFHIVVSPEPKIASKASLDGHILPEGCSRCRLLGLFELKLPPEHIT